MYLNSITKPAKGAPAPKRIEVSESVLARAIEKTMDALACQGALDRLAEYFSVNSNYAGALFLGIEPNDPEDCSAADLFAVSSLSVTIPAHAARRFLVKADKRREFAAGLSSLPEKRLGEKNDVDLEIMWDFYKQVKAAMLRHGARSTNAWITASKLVARKRPALFPVRDNDVTSYLELSTLRTVRQEYVVFRHLMTQTEISERLNQLQIDLDARSNKEHLVLEGEPLRLLDAALWRHVNP